MDSPVGQLKLIANGARLAAILWEHERPERVRIGAEALDDSARPVLVDTERQLNEYFAGTRQRFDIELDFQGTEFQKRVWEALLTIPFGQTRSYAEIARQIGNRNAVRAVGAANGRNPISIIAPCHRVIGAAGELTGFAGGLANKMLLLSLEAGQSSFAGTADRHAWAGVASEPRAIVKRAALRAVQVAEPARAQAMQGSLFGD